MPSFAPTPNLKPNPIHQEDHVTDKTDKTVTTEKAEKANEPIVTDKAIETPSDKITDEAFIQQNWGTPETILDAMRDVVDPELGINIVDLGLVYGVDIDDKGKITVDMTLTSPTCPLTDQLEGDTHYVLGPLGTETVINWVWLPPWTLDMISDDGREQLRAIGFNL